MSIKNSVKLAAQNNLRKYESTIEDGLRSFVEVGKALGMIRLEKLHALAGFDDFDAYVEERFDISRRHADRLISAARVVLILGPVGPKIKNESTARELAVFGRDEGEKMRAVVDEALTRGPITAASIRDVRDELYPEYRTIEGEFREGGRLEIEAPGQEPTDITAAMTEAIEQAAEKAAESPMPVEVYRCEKCKRGLPDGIVKAAQRRCLGCDPHRVHFAREVGGPCEACEAEAHAALMERTETAADAIGTAADAGGPSSTSVPAAPAGESVPGSPSGVSQELQDGIEEGIGCDRCDFSLLVSSVDPDASLTEMRYHLRREHDLYGDAAGLALARVRTISPAADLDDASQGVLQQPGSDSPTGRDLLAEEPLGPAVATADRSETDSPPVPEVLGITWIGLAEFDHHASAGVSDSGVAPAIAVEPVLEGGGLAPDPSSSSDPEPHPGDRLLHALGVLVHLIDELDPEALGPYLFPGEVELLHLHADRIAEFVGRVGLARSGLVHTP